MKKLSKLEMTSTRTAHLLAFLASLGYAVYHIFEGSSTVALFSALASISAFIPVVRTGNFRESMILRGGFALGTTIAIIDASWTMGYRGLILVFPLISTYLLLFDFRQAVILSLSVVLTSLLAALSVMPVPDVIRFGIALSLATAFSSIFAYSITRQKDALANDLREDHLTGIANRRGLMNWLETMLIRRRDEPLTLLYIDLDEFKRINDTYGHAWGDQLLCAFTRRVVAVLDKQTQGLPAMKYQFARLSGDEFALAVFGLTDWEKAENLTSQLIRSVSLPFSIDKTELPVNVSVGLLHEIPGERVPDDLLIDADHAMYSAKQQGKNRYECFSQELAEKAQFRKRVEDGLRRAMAEGGFYTVFMPIYDCDSLKMKGVEVLLRCSHEKLAGLEPDEFIPVAESMGLMRKLDMLVLESVFARIDSLPPLDKAREVKYMINISATELHNHQFPDDVERLLKKYSLPPEMIELELTEASFVSGDKLSMKTLHALNSLGVSLALDDFGTGTTAFNQLMDYPIQTIKIDRRFINGINRNDAGSTALADIVLALAEFYGVNVVAEGVETWEQVRYLREKHCEFLQGHLMCRPMTWHEFLALAVGHKPNQVRKQSVSVPAGSPVPETTPHADFPARDNKSAA